MTSGRFVTQQSGAAAYKAFIPGPLPPDPALDLGGLLRVLSTADRALARLDGVTSTLPDPNLFVHMYVRHEAALSSQIEGTQSTLEDVLDAEAGTDEEKAAEAGSRRDLNEIFNYVDAMNHGLSRLSEFPMSLRLIREIHAHLLQGVRGADRMPGAFRKSQNWVGGENIRTAVYVPPPPYEMMGALHDFEKFLHRPEDLPVLVHCALLHAQFETIHPFLDGNGRIGRLLITLQLCWEQVLQKPLLYLSYYFKAHRIEYYDRLQAIRVSNDWHNWVKFFLRGVGEVSAAATETARKIHSLREELRASPDLTKTGRDFVDALFSAPITTVNRAAALLGCTFVTANNIIGTLESKGVLQEITGQRRNRRYRFRPYLDMFEGQALSEDGS